MCFYNPQNYLKDYVNTWKTDVYRKDKHLSLYNSDTYKDPENKQIFYPVGSVYGEEPKIKNLSEAQEVRLQKIVVDMVMELMELPQQIMKVLKRKLFWYLVTSNHLKNEIIMG